MCILAVAAYFVASSAAFENLVRKRLIAQIESRHRRPDRDCVFSLASCFILKLKQTESSFTAPRIPAKRPTRKSTACVSQVSIFGLFTPHISLRNLEIDRPQLHFIVYRDGSTNQPRPRRPQQRRKSSLQTLFDLRAGQVLVEQGRLDFDDRAASFDAKNRYLPLDFKASNVSLEMIYVPGVVSRSQRAIASMLPPRISCSPASCRASKLRPCRESFNWPSILSGIASFAQPSTYGAQPRGPGPRA